MSPGDILLYSIIGLGIWSAILSAVISKYTRAKKIELHLKKQTMLLAKMAQKAGVPDSEINVILNTVIG